MDLNVNLNWMSDWDGSIPMANCLKGQARGRTSGGGGNQKNVISTAGRGMPPGTYTVLNPSGKNLAVGGFTNPTVHAPWSTATQFTFNYTGGLLALWDDGTLTDPNTAVIIPGHLTSYNSGDEWNSAFISYLSDMQMTSIRLMNSNFASQNIEANWSDRKPAASVDYSDIPFTGKMNLPWELQFDLCNRLNLNPWICIPHRATDAYVRALGTLATTSLNANLKLNVEIGNETWNNGNPWSDGTKWFQYLTFTKKTALANSGTNTYTLNNHGMSNGNRIVSYTTSQNRLSGASTDFRTRLGNYSYIRRVNANQFQLLTSANGSVVNVANGQVNLLFKIVNNSNGDRHGNFGVRCVQMWNQLEVTFPAARITRILATQFTNAQAQSTSVTSARANAARTYANANSMAQHDVIGAATYIKGQWGAGQLALSNGSVIPKFWVNASARTYVMVSPSWFNPTNTQLKSGAGNAIGFSNINIGSAGGYKSFPSINGLTNGTTYNVDYLFVDKNGGENRLRKQFTAAATGTVDVYEAYADTVTRLQIEIGKMVTLVRAHIVAGGDKPNWAYEGGYHWQENAPQTVDNWTWAYVHSQESNDLIASFYAQLAAVVNMNAHFKYKDISFSQSNYWGDAMHYGDITDSRYVARLALNTGVVPPPADTVAPVITPPVNVTAEATGINTSVVIGQGTAIDNIDGVLIPTSNAPASYPVGVTTVTWSATDAAGNIGTALQYITVQDQTPPIVTAPADITVQATDGNNVVVNIGQATAVDIVDTALTVTSDAPLDYPVGTTIVTWTSVDSSGNVGADVQNITVLAVQGCVVQVKTTTEIIVDGVTTATNICITNG